MSNFQHCLNLGKILDELAEVKELIREGMNEANNPNYLNSRADFQEVLNAVKSTEDYIIDLKDKALEICDESEIKRLQAIDEDNFAFGERGKRIKG